MTAREFKDRLAAGDKLAVVMAALWKLDEPTHWAPNVYAAMGPKVLRREYESLASAEAKRP